MMTRTALQLLQPRRPYYSLILSLFFLSIPTPTPVHSFVAQLPLAFSNRPTPSITAIRSSTNDPVATLVVQHEENEDDDHINALLSAGFCSVITKKRPANDDTMDSNTSIDTTFHYTFSTATGMLQLVREPIQSVHHSLDAPRWVQVVRGFENVLVQNGWSFLDPDENEKISAFDINAVEGMYTPKWGGATTTSNDIISSLGFSLRRLTTKEIEQEAESLLHDSTTRQVLLQGHTDPHGVKQTHNGYSFRGSVRQDDLEHGIFVCAIGGLPLFSTTDITMSTVRSGWLSFLQPIAPDHLVLVYPEEGAADSRIEVVCAKSGCHLGHYFGKGNGYCINASGMNLIPSQRTAKDVISAIAPIVSWRALEIKESRSARMVYDILRSTTSTETLVFGAGCFWHIEHAMRRLVGVVSTQVGYAGGRTTAPTYKDVCTLETGHAEVVRVTFDPRVLDPRVLVECFLSLHDPTKVRAHGKHAEGQGQYRSCVFMMNEKMHGIVESCLRECEEQLERELSTEVRKMDPWLESWFWPAEEYHERHDEKRGGYSIHTLSVVDWWQEYGRGARRLGLH